MDYSLLKDEELVILCKENNDAAFSYLSRKYTDVARIVVSRFKECPIEKADLIQEAMFAFISAVYSYDGGKSCSFETYASCCMRNRILSLIRSLSSKKRVPYAMLVPLEESYSYPSAPSPEESLIGETSADYISGLIAGCLTEREQQVFGLFLTGMSYEEIGQKLGVTAKAVDSTLQRARKKLREKLSNYK